jgi:hypothetical protein
MHNQLIPVVVLVVLPALYVGSRLGLLRGRPPRWAAGGALLLAVALSLPFEGMDFLYLKRIKLFLAAATALLLLLRHLKVPWALERARYVGLLAILAALSVVVHLNFFAFHGQRTFVHLHDVAHYYLGSKYYGELGSRDLYTAMLRAESEWYEDHFKAIEARDLESYDLVHIRALLRKSDSVKAAFSPEAWADFRRDVAYFREALGAQYAAVLRDHGFNASPLWALVGGALTRLVPPASGEGIFLLTLLDPLLLVGLAAAICWAFGLEAMLLSLIYLCVLFGAGFGWTGGGLLRTPWLIATVGAVCCLQRRHYATAGALLASASLLRVFPAFFALPLLVRAIAIARRRRMVPRRYLAFFASFLLAGVVLLGLTGLLPRSFHHWSDFRFRLASHIDVVAPNLVGLTQILAYPSSPDDVTLEEFRELKARREAIHRVALWLAFLPLLALVARAAPRERDLSACALAAPLVFVGLNLASYYYAFLVILVLAHRHDREWLTLLFTAEAASYSLMLFEDREGLLYVYRSIVVGMLFLSVYLRPLQIGTEQPARSPAPAARP